MPKDVLDEREFELINIIGAKLGSNQRDLSRRMNLSLGQTNMLVRRLIAKGLIRISQLTRRKVKYLLTTKGVAEKMRKSVKYTLNTINSISLIKANVRDVLCDLYGQGERVFYLIGKSDFVILVEMVFNEVLGKECELHHMKEIPNGQIEGVILIGEEHVPDNINGNKYINLVEEIAKTSSVLA